MPLRRLPVTMHELDADAVRRPRLRFENGRIADDDTTDDDPDEG